MWRVHEKRKTVIRKADSITRTVTFPKVRATTDHVMKPDSKKLTGKTIWQRAGCGAHLKTKQGGHRLKHRR